MEKEERMEAFREWLTEEEKSENTIQAYIKAVDLFFSDFPELNKKNMIAFKKKQIETKSPKTAANRCIAMNRYCEFAGKTECKVKGIKIHKKSSVDNVITEDQYKKMIDGLKRDGNEKGYWMVEYLAKTGARGSEFIRMDKKCLETGVCEIWTKGKIRRILIPRQLIEQSRSYFDGIDGDLLFPSKYGGKMTTRGVGENIKRYAIKYGIPKEVAYSHSFRHLYAIEFLKNNKNIALLADLLGHESVDTTAIYLRLSEDEQRRQLETAMNW